MERHQRLLKTVLTSHAVPNWPNGLTEFLTSLFEHCYAKYAACVEGNPIDHHIVVLQNVIHIAARMPPRQLFGESQLRCLACAALVHDIYTPEKKRKGDEASVDEEASRKYSRAVHMFGSSRQAAEALGEVNHGGFLTLPELAWIQALTAIHDNPSAGIPLPFEKDVLAFREADRLWMISIPGFTFDLLKDIRNELKRLGYAKTAGLPCPDSGVWNDFEERQQYVENARTDPNKWSAIQKLAEKRVRHIADRFNDDADLYPASMHQQLHNRTLFYTDGGYQLYGERRLEVCDLFGLDVHA